MTAPPGPPPAELPRAPVRLWAIPLDAEAAEKAEDLALLDAEERARGARFLRPADRRRHVAAHAGLRRALAAATGRRPESLSFAAGPQGKPALAGGGPFFNLTHGASLALVAVCEAAPVGVDVEDGRVFDDLAGMMRQIGTPAECRAFAALPAERRGAAFLRLWTRKEALLKAEGSGLLHDPRTAEIGLDPAPRRIIGHAGAWWGLCDLDCGPGRSGALALLKHYPDGPQKIPRAETGQNS